jgi:YD repeat-containing protein
VELDNGRGVDLLYTGGLLTQVNAPEGVTLRYEYSGGRLSKFVDGNGQPWQYTYDGGGNLSGIITPKGHPQLRMVYGECYRGTPPMAGAVDNQPCWRAAEQINGENEKYTFAYDDANHRRTVTDAYGNTTTYQFDADYLLTSKVDRLNNGESFTYDGNRQLLSRTDQEGRTYTYSYDAEGNIARIDGPLGWHLAYTYNALNKPVTIEDALNRVTTLTYDGNGNLLTVTNPDSKTMSYTYNASGLPLTVTDFRGNTTEMTYDAGTNDLLTIKDAEGHSTTFSYDDMGRMRTMQTPNGGLYTYSYDGNSQMVQVDGPLGYQSRMGYDANGNLASLTDADGNTTQFTYNASDKLQQVSLPVLPGAPSRNTSFVYGLMNELKQVTDGNGNTASYEYDAELRLVKAHIPLAGGSSGTTELTLDKVGNVLQSKDPLGRVTRMRYDALNRMLEVVENHVAGGTASADENVRTVMSYDLNNNLLAVWDANSCSNPAMGSACGTPTREMTYDVLNRLKTVVVHNTPDEVLQFQYDANSNLTAVVDARNQTTAFTYDKVNQLASSTDALTQITQFAYDGNGNLVRVTDPAGVVTKFGYNLLDQNTELIENFQASAAVDSQTNVLTAMQYSLAGDLRYVTDANNHTTELRYTPTNDLAEIVDALAGLQSYGYDGNGNLTQVTDANNHSTQYAYDGRNRLVTITDPLSYSQQFGYDDGDRMVRVTDKNSNASDLSYDRQDNLVQLLEPATSQHGRPEHNYSYDRVGNLLTYRNPQCTAEGAACPRPSFAVLAYDAAYRMLRTQTAEGHIHEYEYDANSNLTRMVDANSNPTEFTYDPLNRMVQVVNAESETSQLSYNWRGDLLTATQPLGQVTRLDYDPLYRLQSLTENYVNGGAIDAQTNVTLQYGYDGVGNLTTITDAENYTTQLSYDALNRLSAVTDAETHTSSMSYDAVGNLLNYTDARQNVWGVRYNERNEMALMCNPVASSQLADLCNVPTERIQYGYDGNGNLTSIDRPLQTSGAGGLDEFTYDELNRLVQFSNAEGDSQDLTYDRLGNLTEHRSANGNLTRFEYDRLQRLTRLTDAESGIRTFSYDGLNNLLSQSDPNNHTTDYRYDKVSRLVEVEDALGQLTTLRYDANGNLRELRDPHCNALGVSNCASTASTKPNFYNYDALNRVTALSNPLGEITSLSYDRVGNQTSITANDGVKTSYQYDGLRRKVAVTENDVPGGAVDAQTNVTTHYAYDPNGNLSSITDPLNHSTHFDYNARNLLASEQNALGHTWQFSYDGLGNLTEKRNPNEGGGVSASLSYHPDSKLAQIQYADGTSTQYQYDADNNLTLMQDALGTSEFAYDGLNRMVQQQDALGRQIAYEYDANSNLTGLAYPGGARAEYEYDALNRVTQICTVSASACSDINTFQYDEVGNLLASEQANGSQTAYQYDAAYRLTGVATTDINGAVSARASYTLDAVGQRVASDYETSANGSAYTETYTYDGLRRLTSTVSNDLVQGTTYVATYAYDAAGNRTQWTGNDNRQTDAYYDGFVASYSYNSANQLTALDWNTSQSEYNYEESYRYDANGNRTHSERTDHTRVGGHNYGYVWGQEWGYDDENHLTSQTNYRLESDGTRTDYDRTTHQYDGYPLPFDARGRRLASEYQRDVNDPSVDSERNEFLYSGLDLLAEYWLLDASTPSAGSLDSTADTNTYRTEYTLANLQPQAPGLLASQAMPIARTEYPTDGSISHLAQRTDYFHPDGRGNVAGYTNGDGYTQQTYAYDAFGQELPNAASGDAGRAERDLNNIRFASKPFTPTPVSQPSERDTLQYYGARYYDNALAQWATADSYRGTLSLPETLHRYAFVGNSPTAGGEWYGWFINFLVQAAVGAAIGAGIAYGSQVIGNLSQGKPLSEALKPSDPAAIATAAAVGAVAGLTMGAGLALGGAVATGMGVASGSATAVAMGIGTVAVSGAIAGQAARVTQNVANSITGNPERVRVGHVGDMLFDATVSVATVGVLGRITTGSWTQGFSNAIIPKTKVLVVGESDTFEYSINLASRNPNMQVVGTRLGNALNGAQQEYMTIPNQRTNLTLIDNVDATNLRTGITGQWKYNGVVFNNPHAGPDLATLNLLQGYTQSARTVLAPQGSTHVNVTKGFLTSHNLPMSSQWLQSIYSGGGKGSFGTSPYAAPFIPKYTTGGYFPPYIKYGSNFVLDQLYNFCTGGK